MLWLKFAGTGRTTLSADGAGEGHGTAEGRTRGADRTAWHGTRRMSPSRGATGGTDRQTWNSQEELEEEGRSI